VDLAEARRSQPDASPRAEEDPLMGKKIIVVDDSRTVRVQVGSVLKGAGYEVLEATDGHEGMAMIEAHADAAMVICDVNMPNLNGLDMLATIKQGGRHPDLPVVMLTTEAEPALVERAKQYGAKGWIVKPFKPELLVSAVRKVAG
jgi:two-component system, chemotaxis family, chemotaxis protein CheY